MVEESVLLSDLETFKESFSQAIREENVEEQVDMTKKLSILAEHLGQEITRTELLPFLQDNIDIHDEILLNLSEQLQQFIPLVGGYEHSQPVLDILKKICNTDETVVREKTLETLKSIAEDLNSDLTEQLLVPFFEALASEEWFTSKCSAVALFPIIYHKVKEERRDELRHSFRLLSQEESPIVRKAAAMALIELIPFLDKESLKNEFISVFDNISTDTMDSVKVHAIKVALTLCKRLTETEIEQFVFKTLEDFAESDSWKIRQVLAMNLAEIQEAIPFPKLRGRILAMFQKLIKNYEDEVRIVAVKNLVPYCRSLKESYEKPNITDNNFLSVFVQSIVPQIALLVVDPSVDVKLVLAKNILSLSTVISKDIFMDHIMPMVVDILELETSVPVKTNVLENLNDLPQGVDFAQSLPSIKSIVRTLIVYSESHWRTRKSLLVAFMHIAKFAPKEYFSENIKIFYASLLGDPVFAVRRTAAIILPLLAKQYGMTWASQQIIPYFKMFTKDTRYLYRYVPLFGINELLNPSVISDEETKYLSSLKGSKDIPKTAKLLWKLKCILHKLMSRLEQKTFEDILSLNKSIDDFKTDSVSLYAGDTLTSLKTHCSHDIFEYASDKTENPNDWYLTGLVTLISREFLDLILTLFDDKIVNVQIRSIFTLNKIRVFSENLLKECEEPWVAETIKILSKEESDAIEKQTDVELSEKATEIDEENMDTELMKNMYTSSHNNSVPNLEEDIAAIETEDIKNAPEIKIDFIDDGKSDSDIKHIDDNEEDFNVTDNTVDNNSNTVSILEVDRISDIKIDSDVATQEQEVSSKDVSSTDTIKLNDQLSEKINQATKEQ